MLCNNRPSSQQIFLLALKSTVVSETSHRHRPEMNEVKRASDLIYYNWFSFYVKMPVRGKKNLQR